MSKVIRALAILLIVAALLFAGYEIGNRAGRSAMQSQIIENYSFVRDIAQLASLEVNGVAMFTSTNLRNDGSFTDAMKRVFAEQTVHLSVPYTAKYGVDLADSNFRIERRDSMVMIHLPAPKLLSYEVRIDRMDATSRAGIFLSASPELYTNYQKQLYTEGRRQLENNTTYLTQTTTGISRLLAQYFAAAGLRAHCIFDLPGLVVRPKQ